MSVKRTKPLNERLWSFLKEQTSNHDCVVLKCRDSEERRIHRTALMASSTYFFKLLDGDPTLELIVVPYTSETIDLVIEFIYSSSPTVFEEKQAIQLYCAAIEFALEDLSDQMFSHFQSTMDKLVRQEDFLLEDTAEHLKQMKNVFKTVHCDKLLLVTRILRWGQSKKASSEFIVDLLDSVTASITIPPWVEPNTGPIVSPTFGNSEPVADTGVLNTGTSTTAGISWGNPIPLKTQTTPPVFGMSAQTTTKKAEVQRYRRS